MTTNNNVINLVYPKPGFRTLTTLGEGSARALLIAAGLECPPERDTAYLVERGAWRRSVVQGREEVDLWVHLHGDGVYRLLSKGR